MLIERFVACKNQVCTHSDLFSIRCFNANAIGGQAFVPPSTVRIAPVMYDASGPATNATSAATSSTDPQRSSAVLAFWGAAQSPVAGCKSASIGPGWILLTVMRRGPTSVDGLVTSPNYH